MTREELIEEAANAMSQGYVKDGRISSFFALAEAAFAVFEKSQAPTDDEREALPVASRDVWGWDTCVVCGSKEVSDRGMVIMGASKGSPYVARIAWCDQSQECREDLRQTSFLLTEPDVKVIDGFRRPAQTEPIEAQIEVIADSIESFFEEHVHMARRLHPDVWKRDLALVVLKAAFTAGQEEQS